MSDIDFPSTLPTASEGSFSEGALDPWVKDQAGVGATRHRQRFTRELKAFNFTIQVEGADKDALETFYKTTTSYGALDFNWTHPTTDVVYEVRFQASPSITHLTVDLWTVGIALEEL